MHKYLIALVIALGMVLWVGSGLLNPQQNPQHADQLATEQESVSEQIQKVRGMISHAQSHDVELLVRGVTEVNRTVTVRSEINGRVVGLPLPKGALVSTGDVLCEIAIESREKVFSEARALQQQAILEYKGLRDLRVKGLQSDISLAQARARLESANAAVSRSQLALEHTQVKAPFAGTIEDQPVEVGDYLSVGGACATIIETNPILLAGQIAEKDIGHVAAGEHVSALLITGESLRGTISFISQLADKNTRSYRIEVEVPNPDLSLRAGITSELKVPIGSSSAHRISPAVLVLDDEGELGVRVVNADDKVEFYNVQIISEAPDGIWVTGLPTTTRLITIGQEQVFEGELVEMDISPLTSLVSD